MTLGLIMTGVGLVGTLLADFRESGVLRWMSKPLASTGFLVIAFASLASGATFSALHVGLLLSAAGDVALVSHEKKAFLAGLVSFALAHVAYLTYFLRIVFSEPSTATLLSCGAAVAAFAIIGHIVWNWLAPHTGSMRIPVRVYVLLVSLMAASAVTAGVAGRITWSLAPLGGVLFYLSDLSVARDRFISKGFINRIWGLPLYYAGQVLIAIAATR